MNCAGHHSMMAGKRLPYDAEVEYLESTGTQWIDTGVKHDKPHTFDLKANCVPYSGSVPAERDFFGAHSGTQESGNMVCGMFNGVVFLFNRPNNRIDSANIGSSRLDLDITCAFTSNSRTLTVNGGSYYATGASYYDCTITLFRGNPNLSYGELMNGIFRCSLFRIWNQDGILVRDFIPVRKGTVGYMYDRVSGQLFGNEGTGDFVLGPDVVPVEYIESHGTEWINADISTSEGICTEAKFKLNKVVSSSQEVFGKVGETTGTEARYWFGASGSSLMWQYAINKYINTSISADTNVHVAFLDTVSNTCKLDGQVIATFGNLNSNTDKIFLFGANFRNTNNNPMSGRIYYAKIFNNGVLVRSFRPVRVGTDATSWEGAMMDVLTRRIYRNAGTGAFTYGNDI